MAGQTSSVYACSRVCLSVPVLVSVSLSCRGGGSVFKLGSLLLVAISSLKAQVYSHSTPIPVAQTRERWQQSPRLGQLKPV